MHLLEERLIHIPKITTPQRVRGAMGLLLGGFGAQLYIQKKHEETLEQTRHLEQRAREVAQRNTIHALETYQVVSKPALQETFPQKSLDPSIFSLLAPETISSLTSQLANQDRQTLSVEQRQLATSNSILVVSLILAQIYLALRTRRLLSIPLLVTTGLLSWLGWTQWHRISEATNQLSAGQGPTPTHTDGLMIPSIVLAMLLLIFGFWQRWREFE